MKKKLTSKLVLVLLALFLVISTSGCTGQPSDDNSNSNSVTVYISIIYPEDSKEENIEEAPMNVSEKANIQQILEAYCQQESIPIESKKGYVAAINHYKSDGAAGWTYTVNDQTIMKPASEVKVAAGDKIVWKFSTM